MKKSVVALTLVSLLLSGISSQAQDYGRPLVDEVRIQGLERISEQLVRSQIESKAGEPVNPPAISRDVRRLYDLGYFGDVQVDASRENGRLVLTYILAEKRVIDEIKIIGNDKIRDRDIRAVLLSREGGSFLPETAEEERDAILDLYSSKAFPTASVDIAVEEVGPARVRVIYTIHEGNKARIRNITFEGNEALSSRQLRKTMKTKRAKWIFGGRYDEKKFEYDLDAIIEAYGDCGRLEAAIADTRFDYSADGKKVKITIGIGEGPEYTIASVGVANNIAFDTDEVLMPQLVKATEGDVHNKSQVREDAELIEKGYRDSGYLNARVQPKVTLDREAKTTHVVHDVYEGDLKYIREITITGNTVTRDEVIRQRVILEPGDRFDGTSARASQSAVESTGYFDTIQLVPDDVEGDDRFTDLLVDVEEGKTGSIQFGAGYSTEEKFGGYVEITKNNFDILNWPTFEGGGQQLRIKVSSGDVSDEYSLSYTHPQFMGYPFALGIDLFNESRSYTGGIDYSEELKGAQLRFGKSLSPYVSARSFFRYEEADITDLTFLTAPALRRYIGGDLTISSSWGINRSVLDHYRDPSRGAKHDFNFQLAGLGGDNEYYKFEHDSTWYWPLDDDKKWILSYRTREGWVNDYGSSKEVPIQARFFCGGSSSVRGFDNRDVGPKLRRYYFLGEKEAIGGELKLVENIEVKYKIAEMLRAYLFSDAGTVWREANDFDLGDIKYSVGVGLGVDVPRMGPIRLDYGFPLNADDDQGSGKLHLIGGFRF